MDHIVLIGGGEHAKALAHAATGANPPFVIRGYVDPDRRESIPGVSDLGSDNALRYLAPVTAVLAVGAVSPSDTRKEIVQRLGQYVDTWATVIGEAASVAADTSIGIGTVVMAGAVVQPGVQIGRHAIVNSGVVLDHDVVVEDFAILAPGVVVGGGTHIGTGAFIGLGACVRDHVSIGAAAMVAMGAVVTQSVLSGSTVVGIPAQPKADA